MASYGNGGLVPGKSGSLLPGEGASECSIETASKGTAWENCNVSDNATPPGGSNSSGSASGSSGTAYHNKG